MQNAIRPHSGPRPGITLLESMVIVGVLAVSMALLLPAIRRAREEARRSDCINNLKYLSLALHNYHSAWGAFPSGYNSRLGSATGGADRFGVEMGPGWAWGTLLLPCATYEHVYSATNLQSPVSAPESRTVRSTSMRIFLCPSEARLDPVDFHTGRPVTGLPTDLAASQYVACGGTSSGLVVGDGMFGRDRCRRIRDVTDGAGNTIMLGERSRVLSDAAWAGVVCRPGSSRGRDTGRSRHGPARRPAACTRRSWDSRAGPRATPIRSSA